MDLDDARGVLGVHARASLAEVRAAYLQAALTLHPDRPDAPADANDRMILVNLAYAALQAAPPDDQAPPRRTGPANASAAGRGQDDVELHLDGTLIVAAPAEETFFRLADAAEHIGDVTFIDRGAGLLQIMVEPLPGRFCYLTCSLQGRATGTEVFTTVSPVDAGAAPPLWPTLVDLADAVRRAVW